MKLYEIPRGSKIRLKFHDQIEGEGTAILTFHHPDGMYSYCTLDEGGHVVHLSVSTPLKKVGDLYEIDAGEGR